MITKLLIADDEKNTSNAIRSMIPWEKFQIVLCSEVFNGKEAIDLLKTEKPDIALLDIRMPLIDGLGVCRYIKENHLDISIIILSGYDEFSYAQEAIKYGVTDYLLKPCRMEDILNSVIRCRDLQEQRKREKELINRIEQPFFHDLPSKQVSGQTEEFMSLLFDFQGKKLLESLRTGKFEVTEEIIHDLFTAYMEKSCPKTIIVNQISSLMTDVAQLCADCAIALPSQIYELMDFKKLACFSGLKLLEETVLGVLHDTVVKLNIKSEKNTLICTAIQYIKEHYSENLDLNILSNHIHVTPAYFSLLFKMQTGTNFLDYLTSYRIDKACELLKTTSLKNYEVAYQTGFKDETYFSTVFKKLTGLPPSKYRKLHS